MDVKRVIEAAHRAHRLVPAFNIAYLPMMPAVADAVEELGIDAMAEVARVELIRFGAVSLRAVAEAYFALPNRARLSLHLDHVPVIDEDGEPADWRAMIREGLELGYHSVMIDGSRLPLDENIAVAREVAEMAHARGAPCEAELGAVLGHEAGPLPPYDELFASGRCFTRPDEAARFVAETGVDWLSVSIGNIHGAVQGAAKDQPKLRARLNIEHLQKLAEVTGRPLVLHGGSGIAAEHLRAAVQHGIAKINIGTEIRQAYLRGVEEGGESQGQVAVREAIRRLVRDTFHMVQ